MEMRGNSKSPTQRRYTPEEKAQAVRMVRALRAELGTTQGTVQRVARQLGYGVESVRLWVKQAEIDAGEKPGTTTGDAERIKQLEQENRELKRANAILKSASAFFASRSSTAHRGDGGLHRPAPGGVRGRADLRGAAVRPFHLLRVQEASALGAGAAGCGAAAVDLDHLDRELRGLWDPQDVEGVGAGRRERRS